MMYNNAYSKYKFMRALHAYAACLKNWSDLVGYADKNHIYFCELNRMLAKTGFAKL